MSPTVVRSVASFCGCEPNKKWTYFRSFRHASFWMV